MARQKPSRKQAPKRGSPKSSFILISIGLFKLLKAALLILVGIGALKFLHKDLSAAVIHWAQVLRVDPENRFVHRIMERLFHITPKQLKELSIGTFVYAGLFLTEGTGLLMRKRWAEYFTIISTTGLIPLELYELAHHFTVTKVVVLLVNIAIVWYLVARVRSR